MSDQNQNPGDASVNGDQNQNPGQNGAGGDSAQNPGHGAEKSVPYARFHQVNEQKKAAEETLKGLADEALEEIPEDLRDIVPNLPPADKIKWIRAAMKKGLFGKAVQTNGPDSERPGGKPPQNHENMHPYAVIAQGYKNQGA